MSLDMEARMKTLYLVRHGHAERNKKREDLQQRLTKTGSKEVALIARKLKREETLVDLILVSPARRAQETAAIFAKALAVPTTSIQTLDDFYRRLTVAEQVALLKTTSNAHQTVMLIGHVPNMEELLGFLARNIGQISLPPGGCVCLKFNRRSWSALGKASGIVEFVDLPTGQVRKAEIKKIRRSLEIHINEGFTEAVAAVGGKNTVAMKKEADKVAKEMVRKYLKKSGSVRFSGDRIQWLVSPAPENGIDPAGKPLAQKKGGPSPKTPDRSAAGSRPRAGAKTTKTTTGRNRKTKK